MSPDHEELRQHIRNGVIPAVATPYTPDLEMAESALAAHVEDLASTDGVVAIIVNAHTGECKLIDTETKRRVIEVADEAAGDVPVFAGVSGDSVPQTGADARAAQAAGAQAVMPLPVPSEVYSEDDVHLQYYEGVGEQIDIPLLNFQLPTWGTAGVPIDTLVETCKLDNVIGFKEASFDPQRYDRTVRAVQADEEARDTCAMITGNDTFLLQSYHLGAESALIAYGNLFPEKHVEKLRAVHEGDLDRAWEIREELLPLTNFIFQDPVGKYIARIKEALVMLGTYDHATVVPPQPAIGDVERTELRGILDDLGALEGPPVTADD
jgi:4-hydroxy-tetrahydrodipicolinate synthase